MLISLDESRYLDIAKSDPDGFIASLLKRVTNDEVQRAPEILRAIKRSVDWVRHYQREAHSIFAESYCAKQRAWFDSVQAG